MFDSMQEETLSAVQRFLTDAGLAVSARDLFEDPTRQRMSALCYIEHRERVLMIRRKKPPFVGHWTAPGGKLQAGEDPEQAIRREVAEETGLAVKRLQLRLIASEIGPEHYNWLLFFFRAEPVIADVDVTLLSGSRESDEGELDWLPIAELPRRRLPGVEKLLLPCIFPDEATPGGGGPCPSKDRSSSGDGRPISDSSSGGELSPSSGRSGPYYAKIRFNDGFEVETMMVSPLPAGQGA